MKSLSGDPLLEIVFLPVCIPVIYHVSIYKGTQHTGAECLPVEGGPAAFI